MKRLIDDTCSGVELQLMMFGTLCAGAEPRISLTQFNLCIGLMLTLNLNLGLNLYLKINIANHDMNTALQWRRGVIYPRII